MTEEERLALIKTALPDAVNGEERPLESIPTDMPWSYEMPQLIANDPASYAVFNMYFRQIFSNFRDGGKGKGSLLKIDEETGNLRPKTTGELTEITMAMIAYEPSSETRHLGTQQKPWEKLYVKEIVGADGKPLDLSGAQIGDIKWSSVDLTQVGWLVATGAEVGRDTYSDLNEYYASKGYPWGAGDGSTTFNLPNLIGKFAEGALSAGGYTEAGLPNITGRVPEVINSDVFSGAFAETSTVGGRKTLDGQYRSGFGDFDASRSNPIYGNSDTVQPPSALLIPYVKAFKGASADSTDLAISKVANDVIRLSAQAEKINEKGSNFIRYESGLQMCWGRVTCGKYPSANALTFPKPFRDVNYNILMSDAVGSNNVGIEVGGIALYSPYAQTQTACYVTSTLGQGMDYLAVGYWR